MKYKTGLIALGVLAAATALMVFFVLPNIDKDKATEATQQAAQQDAPVAAGTSAAPAPEAGSAAGKTARTEAPAADGAAAGGSGTAAQGAPEGDAAAWQAPSFDVLRVEPDGSTVVAGRAEPNKTLQILNGETVVATTAVNPSGEFAAVFDQPLAVGDHELTLRILGEGGSAKTSEEVATVSIPKDKGGELLAMVSKPGAASRLITVPETASGSQAGANTNSEVGQGAAPSAAQPSAAGTAETAAVAPRAGAAASTGETAPAAAGTGPNVRISAVELEGDRMFVAGSTNPGALVRIYANDKLLGEMKADPDGRYVVDGVMPLAVGRHTIRADVMSADAATVELRASVPFDRPEGEQVAVVAQEPAAGNGAPSLGLIDNGTFDMLRAEANKAVGLLGSLYDGGRQPSAEELAAARSATEIALQSLAQYKAPPGSAGEPIAAKTGAVAADALAKLKALPKDAASVGQAVGEISAAVKDALTPATTGNAPLVAAAPAVDIAALETRALDLGRAFADLFAAGRNALPDEIGTARASLQQTLDEIVAYTAPTGTDAMRLAVVDQLKVWARGTAAALSGVPAGATGESYAGVVAALKAAPEALLSQAQVATAGSDPAAASGTSSGGGAPVASDAQPAGSGAQASAAQPQTVEQEPLQQSKNSVIIRRGDTLWQIARRVYGQGVRYTTIYLANEDQINNPDRIRPGQVFGVPNEAMPEAEAEEIHRKHVRGK